MRRSIAALGVVLVLTILAACSAPETPKPRVEPMHSVGDRVPLGRQGVVTLSSVTTTAPPDHGKSLGRPQSPTVWVYLDFENTSDASVTIDAPRGPARPVMRESGGTRIGVLDAGGRVSNGGGSWSLGPPIYLNPGGVLHATFGVRSESTSGVLQHPFTIEWAPTGVDTVKFLVR